MRHSTPWDTSTAINCAWSSVSVVATTDISNVEMTFTDRQMYTRPFTVRIPHDLLADDDIFEMFPENEKDCQRIWKKE